MTAEAVEDQADTRAPSPRAEHLAQYLEAMTAADKALRLAIAAELAEELPRLEQDQAEAAKVVEVTYAALEDPERDIAELDAEIAGAKADRARWQAKLSDETPREERAAARFQHAECEADIARLTQRREFAEAQALPLRDALAKAQAGLRDASGAVAGRKLNATPALAYYAAGQKSAGYAWRFGIALEGVLRDRDHPEHDAAVDYMLHLCQVSGFRTEDYAGELPSDAEQARRFWDQVYAAAQHAEPAPSGREVAGVVHAEMAVAAENKRLEASPVRIDDRRAAAPVRNPPQRSYMQPPASVRDMGIR